MIDENQLNKPKKRGGRPFQPGHSIHRPKGAIGKEKREQKELLATLREIVGKNVELLETSFPQLVADRPSDAWRIAIAICPKELTMEHKGLELPPIVKALEALRNQVKVAENGNG